MYLHEIFFHTKLKSVEKRRTNTTKTNRKGSKGSNKTKKGTNNMKLVSSFGLRYEITKPNRKG